MIKLNKKKVLRYFGHNYLLKKIYNLKVIEIRCQVQIWLMLLISQSINDKLVKKENKFYPLYLLNSFVIMENFPILTNHQKKIFNLFIVGFSLEATFILEAGTYPVVMSLIQVKNGLSPMLTPALVVPCWWDQLTSLEVLSGWSLVWRMK